MAAKKNPKKKETTVSAHRPAHASSANEAKNAAPQKAEETKGSFGKSWAYLKEAVRTATRRPLLMILIFFIDAAFLWLHVANSGKLNQMQESFIANSPSVPKIMLLLAAIFLASVLIYSFAKYLVMGIIGKMLRGMAIEPGRFPRFFLLNLAIFLIMSLSFGLLVIFFKPLITTPQEQMNYVMKLYLLLVCIIVLLLGYFFINICHSIFFISGKKSIIRTISLIFSGKAAMMLYYAIFSVVMAMALTLCLGLLGRALTLILSEAAVMTISTRFEMVKYYLSYALAYVLISLGRIYYYLLAEDSIQKADIK